MKETMGRREDEEVKEDNERGKGSDSNEENG